MEWVMQAAPWPWSMDAGRAAAEVGTAPKETQPGAAPTSQWAIR
jgi:hypothetical protein